MDHAQLVRKIIDNVSLDPESSAKTHVKAIIQVEAMLSAAVVLMHGHGMDRKSIAQVFYECADRLATSNEIKNGPT